MLLLEVCVAREQQETRIGLETLVPTQWEDVTAFKDEAEGSRFR